MTGLMLWMAKLLLLFPIDQDGLPRSPALEPDEALQAFVITPGFEMQLLAAEPLVTDPVAMVYDEYGRAFVAEMKDYPFTDPAADIPFTEKTVDLPLGQIRLLEDLNGDGVFDRSTVFADGLSWPTGLAVWKNGLYVVATPDLWYLKDTSQDGYADLKVKVLTGFRKFNVQAVINNLQWGFDHRLYGAGSSNGGRIRAAEAADGEPLVMAAGDFRFDPDRVFETFELLSGGARFGNTFDDWGHRFICNIRNPIQQIVLPRHYLARNGLATYRSAVHDVAVAGDAVPVWRSSPPEPWRILNARRLASDPTISSPRSETVATGYMTSASGVTIYRGDAYPQELYGTVFLGEVAGNLIHHQRLQKQGVVYSSERTHAESEFLTSTDNWFRPVNFVNAPDGTLHVLDMYRETIEHPWSIPDDIKQQLDLESGRDRGRIYRLAPTGFQPQPAPRLSDASTGQLVYQLASPRSWYRETAHRLLFERQDPQAVPLLRNLLQRHASAPARLLAFWSLHGLGALNSDDLLTGFGDLHPAVRIHALSLSESVLLSETAVRKAVIDLARDTDAEVRFQAAFSLGVLLTPVLKKESVSAQDRQSAVEALGFIAALDANDPFTRSAVLSSCRHCAANVLAEVLRKKQEEEEAVDSAGMLRDLAMVVGAGSDQQQLDQLFASVMNVPVDGRSAELLPAVVVGLGNGLKRSRQSLTELLSASRHPGAARLADVLSGTITRLVLSTEAAGQDLSDGDTVLLAELLGYAEYEQIREPVLGWLQADHPAAAQVTAVRVLATHQKDETADELIARYRTLRAPARMEIVESLLSRSEWHPRLLEAVKQGFIPLFDIPQLRRNLLLRSRNDHVREHAVELFAASLSARRDVVDQYRNQLPSMTASRERGELVYRRECQICHRLGDAGQELGPNLTTIRHRAPDEVLLHILDPNREVAPDYIAQVVVTHDGRILTGLVSGETTHQITLKLSTGAEMQIARADIEEISTTGQSLMPVGLEQRINIQEMADLLQFLLR